MSTESMERRHEARGLASGAVRWRERVNGEERTGWLIDRSGQGLGILVRGTPPEVGSCLELYPEACGGERRTGFVRRVEPVQAGVWIVGARLFEVRLMEPPPEFGPRAPRVGPPPPGEPGRAGKIATSPGPRLAL